MVEIGAQDIEDGSSVIARACIQTRGDPEKYAGLPARLASQREAGRLRLHLPAGRLAMTDLKILNRVTKTDLYEPLFVRESQIAVFVEAIRECDFHSVRILENHF